jgi:hypothetical protein
MNTGFIQYEGKAPEYIPKNTKRKEVLRCRDMFMKLNWNWILRQDIVTAYDVEAEIYNMEKIRNMQRSQTNKMNVFYVLWRFVRGEDLDDNHTPPVCKEGELPYWIHKFYRNDWVIEGLDDE